MHHYHSWYHVFVWGEHPQRHLNQSAIIRVSLKTTLIGQRAQAKGEWLKQKS
jgi:hypothetical protein